MRYMQYLDVDFSVFAYLCTEIKRRALSAGGCVGKGGVLRYTTPNTVPLLLCPGGWGNSYVKKGGGVKEEVGYAI